jgi:rod shape-determining protein MreC
MARRQIKVPRKILIAWFTLGGLILLFAPQKLTNKFQFAFARLFQGPLNVSKSVSLSARAQQPLGDLVTRREYNRLQNYLANIMEELTEERQKVKKLSGIHDRRPLEGANLVFADVITDSINGSRDELIINRGEYDGLQKDLFVIGDNSIIGTISELSPRTAKVKLITDPTSKMPVKIAGVDTDRMMQGAGGNFAKILMLPIKHKVKVGDVVSARKRPGFLAAPMIVGAVAQCKKDDENPLLWDIKVTPACDVEKLSDVAVIIMNPQN